MHNLKSAVLKYAKIFSVEKFRHENKMFLLEKFRHENKMFLLEKSRHKNKIEQSWRTSSIHENIHAAVTTIFQSEKFHYENQEFKLFIFALVLSTNCSHSSHKLNNDCMHVWLSQVELTERQQRCKDQIEKSIIWIREFKIHYKR